MKLFYDQMGDLDCPSMILCLQTRTGEPRPLLCLSQHPGQSHLLAVGGVANDSGGGKTAMTTSYIWDLREERHPLSEITCRGSVVWEIRFHPYQPQFLYLATEEAGLMRIHSPSPAGRLFINYFCLR